jgi:DNA-binding beta-propeller fold protein YncE
MNRTRTFYISGTFAALLGAAGVGVVFERAAAAQGRPAQVPQLQVDPLWPMPFPVEKHWALGSVVGVAVDAQDHIWVTNRGVESLQGNEKGPTQTPWASQCCFAAPQVLEFDVTGKLVSSWDKTGSGFDWPQSPSAVAIDSKGNIWVAAGLAPPAPGGRGGRGAAPPADGAAAAPAGRGGAAAPGGARGGAAAGGAGAAAGGRGGRGGAAAGGGAAAAGGAAPAGGQAARGAAPAAGAAAPAARGGAPAAPPPPADAQVLAFSKTGQFIRQIGKAGQVGNADSQTNLNRPSGLAIDDAANEVYVADTGSNRIVVFDMNSGAFKRMWGAYGEKPAAGGGAYDPSAPPSRQFHDPTCVKIAKDGMVYVCDRGNDRIQVFSKDGKFQKEMQVQKQTTGEGSVWDVAFSPDQKFLYVADGQNKTVWVLDRNTLETLTRFGDGGRYPGMFYGIDRVAVDSKGNVYTGETYEGKRVQKWIYKGMGAAKPMTMDH